MWPFKKKISKEEKERTDRFETLLVIDNLICPYCDKEINYKTGVANFHHYYCEATLVGCPHCKKVLGGTTHLY